MNGLKDNFGHHTFLADSPVGKGFLFAAIGQKYIDEAIQSAKSIKRHMTSVPVTLVTEHSIDAPDFDNILIVPRPAPDLRGIKLYKPLALLHTPYLKTIFLDSDTYLCSNCAELFSMMDYAELLLAHDTADLSTPVIEGKALEGFYPYNSGVLGFQRSQRMEQFLSRWYETLAMDFDKHPWDQRAMMSSLLALRIQTYVLQPIYNCRTNFIVGLPQHAVKIIHGRGESMWVTERKLNQVRKNRVWLPRRRRIMTKKRSNQLLRYMHKAVDRIRRTISESESS